MRRVPGRLIRMRRNHICWRMPTSLYLPHLAHSHDGPFSLLRMGTPIRGLPSWSTSSGFVQKVSGRVGEMDMKEGRRGERRRRRGRRNVVSPCHMRVGDVP